MPNTAEQKTGRGFQNGVHWSQTPAGRKRMSEIATKRNRTLAKKKRAADREVPIHKHKEIEDATRTRPELDEATFAYALGYIESWLSTYSASAGVSTTALTSRVGKVLHSKAGR